MYTKKWYQSKTVWLNLIASLLGILGYFNADLLLSIGVTNPAKFISIIGVITTIGNVILRAGGQPTIISAKQVGTYIQKK